MSDNSGRRLSFIISFVIFTIGNVGLAVQTNYTALLLLRMVQAVGGTASIALTYAVVADITTTAERGTYLGYAGAGILTGQSLGPTIGGLLAQYLGWRSIFWFLAIFSGTLLFFFIIFFPETCRNVVGSGSIPATGIDLSVFSWYQQHRSRRRSQPSEPKTRRAKTSAKKRHYPNPLPTFRIILQKESSAILIYNGFFFTGMMVVVSAIPTLYKETYGLNELQIGLCYLSNGIGSLVASLTMGHIVDWNFRRHAKKLGITINKRGKQDLRNFPIERVRLQVVLPGHLLGILGLVAFGWTVKFHTNLAAPEVALFVLGFGTSTAFNISNALLMDLHGDQPAAAAAAVNLVRCLMSAGGSAAIIPMCNAMNPGWAFSCIALSYVPLTGVLFWLMRFGEELRRQAE
jgi:MFS family permease